MADVYFKCVCGKSLAVDEKGIGQTVLCVDCQQPVKVPEVEIEFTCEGCQAVLLAPLTVVGDRIKCALCGHRMTVPRPVVEADAGKDGELADEDVKEKQTLPATKLCMDALMRKRAEFSLRSQRPCCGEVGFQARSRPMPEPTLSGWLFRLAILAVVLVATGELMHRFIQGRPLALMPKELVPEALAPGAADTTSARQAVTETPTPAAAETLVASVQKPKVIPETVRVREMTGKFIPPSVGESAVVTKEPPRISSAPPVLASAKVPAQDLWPIPAKPGVVAGKAPGARIAHPAKFIPPPAGSLPEEKHVPATAEEKEAKYAAMRVMHLKQQVPALQELVAESQKLNSLINYKTGWKQRPEFFGLLEKCMGQINQYTRTHSGKDLDDFYWSTSYFIIYGHAIRTAPNYEEAEKVLRQGWELLEGTESGNPRAVPRTVLSMGVNLAQDWVKENPLECAILLDELEGLAQEMGDDKVGDIWRLNAPGLQVRFMKYAGKVPEEKREAFFQQHKQRLERYLVDDSIRMRNRAATLRGWIVFLDKYGSLTDALPVIHEWPKRYGDKTLEMNYYFARLWVELFGEGDLEKAAKTVRLATQAAQRQRDGKLFDEKNYVKLIQLYYDSLRWPAYELKRQRTIARNKADNEELKTAFYKGKAK